jgi:predicted DCC family thiol-disulfide oxidoreductase YuxK
VKELKMVWPDLNPADGVMLWEQGEVYQGMEAVLRIAAMVGGLLHVVVVLRLLPEQSRDKLYHWVARNRYGWFGKREPVCDLSLQKYSDRFLA